MRSRILGAALVAVALSAGVAGAASICGDVNESGKVTSSDALQVLKYAVGQPVQLLCSPVGQLPKTGETTGYGPGSDGVVQAGAAHVFTDNGDGTITDDATGLMWEKKGDAGGIHDKDNAYTWSASGTNMDGSIATVFLAALNGESGFAGHTDWRIPNRLELESLLSLGADTITTYPEFNASCAASCNALTCSCTLPSNYWTSTSYHSSPYFAWYTDFGMATSAGYVKTDPLYVRAVRNAN